MHAPPPSHAAALVHSVPLPSSVQATPAALGGCVHLPFPLHSSLVQSFPSWGQPAPASLLLVTQRLVVVLHVACLHRLAGCLQTGLAVEQVHFFFPAGPTH